MNTLCLLLRKDGKRLESLRRNRPSRVNGLLRVRPAGTMLERLVKRQRGGSIQDGPDWLAQADGDGEGAEEGTQVDPEEDGKHYGAGIRIAAAEVEHASGKTERSK